MKRAILGLLLAAVPVLGAGQSDARIVKPEIRVGDRWTYRSTNLFAPGTHDVDNRVSFASDKVILVITTSKGGDKEVDTSWTPEWNAVKPLGEIMFRPDSGVFRFPMRAGDKYAVNYELLRPRLNTVLSKTTGAVTVMDWETVEVPAGKFRAMRLELDSMVQPTDGSRGFRRQSTVWYVPDVRRWVKVLISTPKLNASEELLEYKLNED